MRLYRPRDPAAPAGAAAPCGRGRMALRGDGFGRGLGATTRDGWPAAPQCLRPLRGLCLHGAYELIHGITYGPGRAGTAAADSPGCA